jgi:hypothetical protein
MARWGRTVTDMAGRCGVCAHQPGAVGWWLARLAIFAAAGALPVLSISLHVLGVMSMELSSVELVIPAALVAGWLCLRGTPESVPVMRGAVAGIAGVAAYDGVRLPFVIAGVWPDFIPAMGAWINGGHGSNVVLGYTWRVLGDGGGIAVVFALGCVLLGCQRRLIAIGIAYGVFVWSCLITTILLAPRGAELLFPLTGLNLAASLVGHLVYGSVAGWTYGVLCRRAGRRLDPALRIAMPPEQPPSPHSRRAAAPALQGCATLGVDACGA